MLKLSLYVLTAEVALEQLVGVSDDVLQRLVAPAALVVRQAVQEADLHRVSVFPASLPGRQPNPAQ